MSFGEKFRATDNIKAIIDEYPFSIGIFREILQNSDDAGAVKQVFLLDRRNHDSQREEYAVTQGPALLAFNDKGFLEEDWQALQEVHSSLKRRDTTKIGKYGIGFRSCYHITDNPQIMSGEYFAVFDPHNKYGGSGRYDVLEERSQFTDRVNAFRGLLPEDYNGRLQGTIFRFPLRVDPNSEISSKVVDPEEIKGLLQTFWKEELEIVLLFLRHISTIEIHEIDAFGTLTVHATCHITRHTETLSFDFDDIFASYRLRSCEVVVSRPEERLHKIWQILDASYAREHASSVLFQTLYFNAGPALEKNKLSADLALAIPTTGEFSSGRLFTFLPLPLSTGFPVHVHGLFALTPSRQHLRNNSEHVVKQSDDRYAV
uniref:Sacsin/Nov domain-containing protein n=1 Tax=Moniliophthora roreri TaxID=221103 RepID=A0A0W0G821_MONRR